MSRGRTYVFGIAVLGLVFTNAVMAQGSKGLPFTYQGQLKQAGDPVTGPVEFRFGLWNADVSGTQVGSTYTPYEPVNVVDGLFTATVETWDFGPDAFNGEPRWLEIEVSDPNTGWVTLSPRQMLTASPFALYAFDGLGGGGDCLWELSGSDIYYNAGNVGVGNAYPWAKLDVLASGKDPAVWAENWDDGTSAVLVDMGIGVSGTTWNADGAGVYGANHSWDAGLCVGVWGHVSNPDGYAGLFEGRGYFTDDVGIGRIPTAKLDVAGTLKTDGFQLTDSPVSGYVLTSDELGNGTWQPAGAGSSPWNVSGSDIYYDAGNVGIGTQDPTHLLHVLESEAETSAVVIESSALDAKGLEVRLTGSDSVAIEASALDTAVYGSAGFRGGTFYATADTGRALFGYANAATNSVNYGVYGQSQSTSGRGVYGYGLSSSGQAVGVLGETLSPGGYGVWGYNDDDSGSGDAVGVYGSTNSPTGIGVKGYAYAPDGYGVYGRNDADTGNAIGGYFKTNSTQGFGIWAEAMTAQSGYAGYFVGRGYFSNSVGIGTTLDDSPLTVAGVIESLTGGFKFPDGTIQTTAGGGGGSLWQQVGSEIYYDVGNVGVGVSDPHTTLHVAGGNWDLANTEGDFKIGSGTYRLKVGVATAGGGAGTCRIFAGGPSSKLVLGANGQDRLTVTGTDVGIGTLNPMAELDVVGTVRMDGFQLDTAPQAGYVLTCDASGTGTWQQSTGGSGFDLPYEGTTAVNGPAFKIVNTDPGSSVDNHAAHFESAGLQGAAVYAKANSTYAAGLKAEASGEGCAVLAVSSDGYGLSAKGGYAAARFEGNVMIYEYGTNDKVIELGKGLDYAEGFDVTNSASVEPGTVLVLDSRHAGQLVTSTQAYDRKVAGIVAGAKGLGSGVRLGGEFDHDVALAGRVYCSVVATGEPIEIGDLLTTSDVPGCAMKVKDHQRAQGAILGKAMEPLAAGERGQILVLVTLQ